MSREIVHNTQYILLYGTTTTRADIVICYVAKQLIGCEVFVTETIRILSI